MEYEAVRIFKALSNQSRLDILNFIYKKGICGVFEGDVCSEKCSCMGDIVQELRLAPSTISHHIKELSHAGLVEVERDGQFVRVSPNSKALKALEDWMKGMIGELKAG